MHGCTAAPRHGDGRCRPMRGTWIIRMSMEERMTRTHRFAFVAALMVAPPVLMAQEPVDTSFKLVAASVGDQEKAGLGQDRQY